MKRRDIIVLSALLTLVGSVYFSTLAVNHCEAEDSLRYLKTISTGSVQEQFHPHHLLYHIVNFSLYHGIHALGVEASVEATAQSLNAAFGLLGLAVLFALMTRLGLSWFLRVISLLFLASSYGYWWYSFECEVYIMPLPFILLAFYMIAGMYTAFSSRLNHVLLAIFFALAVLFHQQHALLLGPILAGYGFTAMTKRDEIPAKTILARLVLFGCLSALFVAAPYLYVIFLIHELSSVAEITHWVLDYAASGMDEGWSITGLLKGILFAPRLLLQRGPACVGPCPAKQSSWRGVLSGLWPLEGPCCNTVLAHHRIRQQFVCRSCCCIPQSRTTPASHALDARSGPLLLLLWRHLCAHLCRIQRLVGTAEY